MASLRNREGEMALAAEFVVAPLILAIVTTILHLRGGAHLVRRIRSVGYFPQQVSLLEYGRS
jgi:hypothetical protein